MELIEIMCDSCHDLYEFYENDFDSSERSLCFECETAINNSTEE